jgi:hypothetical protein
MPDYSGFSGSHNVKDITRFLQLYVAEIVFVRRRKAKDPSVTVKTRRMICTLNYKLLNSAFGKKNLKFKPPLQTAFYNAPKVKLVTVWDIIMQDWRNIDVNSAAIIAKGGADSLPMQVNTEEEMVKFINFYDKKIARMTVAEKRRFMDT